MICCGMYILLYFVLCHVVSMLARLLRAYCDSDYIVHVKAQLG